MTLELKIEMKKYQMIVDKEIEKLSNSFKKQEYPFLKYSYSILKEYLLRGGKRLRAISCIKSYESFTGKKDKRILLPAISLELFHASSLVHDDIMDEDDTRRNKASMHKMYQRWHNKKFKDRDYKGPIFSKDSMRFATSSAIIQGNIMFSLGMYCLTNCKFEDKLRNNSLNLCQESYRKVNEGQLIDVLDESKTDITEKDYIDMAALKTGKLFATSLELGTIFAGVDSEKRKLMYDLGMNIAIAFQIQDDIMDISEKMKKGNTLGSDIRKGKMTLLMINALKNSTKDQKKYLMKISGKVNATKAEIKKVVKIFEETGSVDRAKELAEKYVQKGKNCLKKLKKSITAEGYSFFEKLADYMTKRVI